MGEDDLHLASLVCRKRQPFPEREQQIICINFLEPRMISLGITVHIEQAIAFPVQVCELRYDIALDACMRADIFNFKFEGIDMQTLTGFRKRCVGWKNLIEMIILEALFHATWIHDTLTPLQSSIEPPGHCTIVPSIKQFHIR